MKAKPWIAFLFWIALLPFSADAKLARDGDANVSFTAVGPGGLKIVGTTSDLSTEDDDKAVKVVVPLGNLTTGISLRDKHMREKYLEVPKYPSATLEVTRGALKFPAAGAESSGDAPGTVTIHGRSRPTTVHYTAKRNGDAFAVSGTMHVDMREFAIDVPSYLGVTVKPDVDVAVRFTARDK